MKEGKRNTLNGILGTIIFHLVIVLLFLIFKLGDVKKKHVETMRIEFLNDMVKIDDYLSQKELPAKIQPLDDKTVKNIAVNVANKLEKEISTEKYEDEVKKELGIKDLKQELDRTIPEDNSPKFVEQSKKESKQEISKQNKYKGKTRIIVNLANRGIRHQDVPVYKCEIGGIVIVNIVVDQEGRVINASQSNDSNTRDECLVDEAISSAYSFIFSADLTGEPRQRGTITFEFLSQ